MGILENVLVQIKKFIIPVDCIVLEMEEDAEIPIILGRPFLATAGAVIDVKNGRLTFKIGEEEVEFNLFDSVKYPSFTDNIFRVDVITELTEDVFKVGKPIEPLENCFIHAGTSNNEVLSVSVVVSALDDGDDLPRYKENRFEKLGKGKPFPLPLIYKLQW